MDNQNMTHIPTPQPLKPSKSKLTTIIILIVVLVIAALVIYWAIQKSTGPVATPDTGLGVTQQDDGFPDVFYSYVGTITNIQADKITIEAKASKNYLNQDSHLTVLINEQTTFTKISVPAELKQIKTGQAGKLLEHTEIKLSDLAVGDEITVIAYENIKGKTEFTAKRVENTQVRPLGR